MYGFCLIDFTVDTLVSVVEARKVAEEVVGDKASMNRYVGRTVCWFVSRSVDPSKNVYGFKMTFLS